MLEKLKKPRAWAVVGECLLGLGVLYVWLAFPTLERVDCLRSGPWNDLKTVTSVGRLGIWLAYMVISGALIAFWTQVRAVVPAGLLTRYGTFILGCGLTHLVGFAVFFTPYYWVAAKLEVATAAISLVAMVETVARKRQILGLVGSGAALAREAHVAREATAEAERQAVDARRARAAEVAANHALAEINLKLEEARQAASERAKTAETRNVDLLAMVKRLEAQDAALATLESPILEALDGVLVSVLVGALSSARAQDWTERLTAAVHAAKARAVVVDVTGLVFVDTAVAGAILRTVRCVRIVGARVVVTGVRPEVGQTLVGLGVDLGDVPTLGTLRRGLELAGRWARKEET